MKYSNNKTSFLVSGQLPRFVREEHETFVKFLEYYYKFLEQDGESMYVSKNFNAFLDVDNIAEDIAYDLREGENHAGRENTDYHIFLQKFYDNYIKLIPDSLLADKTLILKHAKEFYATRGSEKSVQFLINALFNKNATFYYPKVDVLRASDGKWFVERSLKISDIKVNNVSNSIAISNFVNHKIIGLQSNAYATVEQVDSFFDKGQLVTELKLSNTYREFIDGEKIFTYYTEEGIDKYLTAILFGGIIVSARVEVAGNNYIEGQTIPVIGGGGSGAQIVVSRTSRGSVKSIGVTYGGAGFRVNDAVLITGGGGSGAIANVSGVLKDGSIHSNTYNVVATIISLEANTTIGNAVYSNLVNTISDPANSSITSSMVYWVYGNTGPVTSCFIINGGSNFTTAPISNVSGNSVIRSLGILGRMEIANTGFGYQTGDLIEFYNVPGGYGSGARGSVDSVDFEGKIEKIKFDTVAGFEPGGAGYDQHYLPVANIRSANAQAYGGKVIVRSVLADGENLVESLSSIGSIIQLQIISGGSGYNTAPTLDLASYGDGTACANLGIVTGVYSYPGRFLNDDGMVSSYNFLQDRDYYQNFSYVIKLDESINKYRTFLKDLIHPAGTKVFGEYTYDKNANIANAANVTIAFAETDSVVSRYTSLYEVQGYRSASYNVRMSLTSYVPITISGDFSANIANVKGTFIANGNVISVNCAAHGLNVNSYFYGAFANSSSSANSANLANAIYVIYQANANQFNARNTKLVNNGTIFGNVYIYNPLVTITGQNKHVANGDTVLVKYDTDDTTYENVNHEVVFANTTTIKVVSANISLATKNTGTVNVYTNTANIYVKNHGYSTGRKVYVKFISGDTANVVNGYQTVSSTPNANVFCVRTTQPVTSDGLAYVHFNTIDINLENHGVANSANVYLSFTGGDLANTSNGDYNFVQVNANTFSVNTSSILNSNGSVRVYFSNTIYNNIVFTKSVHGLSGGNDILIEFDSADLPNGIFKVVNVYDENTYNIKHTGVTVKSEVSMSGIAYSGLYE